MKYDVKKKGLLAIAAILIIFFCGCGDSSKKPAVSPTKIPPDATIGSLTEIISPDYIPVTGYALVGELKGTGSTECPAPIRMYLRQYILKHLPSKDVEGFINSRNTAVTFIEGLLPTAAFKGDYFDVRVTALGQTQTTSLEGGYIYGAEMRAAGAIGLSSKVLTGVQGPVYIDKLDGPPSVLTSGYILGGARVLDNYMAFIMLREPDFIVASAIRNKIVERFGNEVARAIAPGQVELTIPPRYREQKQRFISVIKATHLYYNPEQISNSISEAVAVLAGSGGDKDSAEIVIESIGNAARGALMELLDSPNQEVRLRAARCLLNFGNDNGLRILSQIALDKNSPYRIEALHAITRAARRNDAASIARRLLRDSDIEIRLEAYEQLRNLRDIAIASESIGVNFELEQVGGTPYKTIFAARSGKPRIALFGGPIYCKEDIFIQSEDGNITINAQPGQGYVTVMRLIPNRPDIGPVTMKCSLVLNDIIRTLGAEPVNKNQEERLGLAVAYSDIALLLKQMVEKGAVEADFRAGPMPQINLKK